MFFIAQYCVCAHVRFCMSITASLISCVLTTVIYATHYTGHSSHKATTLTLKIYKTPFAHLFFSCSHNNQSRKKCSSSNFKSEIWGISGSYDISQLAKAKSTNLRQNGCKHIIAGSYSWWKSNIQSLRLIKQELMFVFLWFHLLMNTN